MRSKVVRTGEGWRVTYKILWSAACTEAAHLGEASITSRILRLRSAAQRGRSTMTIRGRGDGVRTHRAAVRVLARGRLVR